MMRIICSHIGANRNADFLRALVGRTGRSGECGRLQAVASTASRGQAIFDRPFPRYQGPLIGVFNDLRALPRRKHTQPGRFRLESISAGGGLTLPTSLPVVCSAPTAACSKAVAVSPGANAGTRDTQIAGWGRIDAISF